MSEAEEGSGSREREPELARCAPEREDRPGAEAVGLCELECGGPGRAPQPA